MLTNLLHSYYQGFVETQTLGRGDTNLGNKIHATRQNQKSTELFNFQINFFSLGKNNVMSTLELQEQLIRKIQIMTDHDILAGVLQFIELKRRRMKSMFLMK